MEDNNLNNEEVSDIVNEENSVENILVDNNSNGNNNKLKKILITIIVIIVLFLLALTIYVVVDKRDNNKGNDNNNQQESENTMVSLTIDLNGGTDNVDYKDKYKKGEEIELVEPIREGYVFLRWDEGGAGRVIDNKLIMNRDGTVKAIWGKIIDVNENINYKILTIEDEWTPFKGFFYKELYINNKQVEGVGIVNYANAYNCTIEVKEFNDVFLVDKYYGCDSRELLIVNKEGKVTEIDYEIDTNSNYITNSIDSYRIVDNNLYIKVKRINNYQLDWYCNEKSDYIAEYELKYDFIDGKFVNRQIINKVTIEEKYKNNNCGINVLNYYTKENIKQFVYDFPYARSLDSGYTYDELWTSFILDSFFKSENKVTMYSPENEIDTYENVVKGKDENGVKYPRYEFGSTEHVYMLLGLTVEEISKKGLDVKFVGGQTISFMHGEQIRNKIKSKYGDHSNLFLNSFTIGNNNYIYDKQMDILVNFGAGIINTLNYQVYNKIEILNEKEENNEYKIEFVEGFFRCEEGNCTKVNLIKNNSNISSSASSSKIIDVYNNSNDYELDEKFQTEYKNILRKNQDKLNKYEVVFEKLNDGYTYKSIRKIENNG